MRSGWHNRSRIDRSIRARNRPALEPRHPRLRRLLSCRVEFRGCRDRRSPEHRRCRAARRRSSGANRGRCTRLHVGHPRKRSRSSRPFRHRQRRTVQPQSASQPASRAIGLRPDAKAPHTRRSNHRVNGWASQTRDCSQSCARASCEGRHFPSRKPHSKCESDLVEPSANDPMNVHPFGRRNRDRSPFGPCARHLIREFPTSISSTTTLRASLIASERNLSTAKMTDSRYPCPK